MSTEIKRYIIELAKDLVSVDSGLVLLMVFLVTAVIVLDAVSLSARTKRDKLRLNFRSTTISLDGSKSLPGKDYVSLRQGLAGKPDAVIIEGESLIPVERKPLAKKIRDRYVAQLLVYMRLIEEFEGKKPPYGYLVLGPSCRKVRIDNTIERQKWLQKYIDEMQAILQGFMTPKPDPQMLKCKKCDVRQFCKSSAYIEPSPNKILRDP